MALGKIFLFLAIVVAISTSFPIDSDENSIGSNAFDDDNGLSKSSRSDRSIGLTKSIGNSRMSTTINDDDPEDVFAMFPDCNNDGLNIRWAHAVNSWAQLNETLSNETIDRIHMIEGDVIIRQPSTAVDMDDRCSTATNDRDDEPIPVMAHPPATDSNLTFYDWLTTINQFDDAQNGSSLIVGAKADFKSLEAAQAALKIVQSYRSELRIPVWLNADIVRGPKGAGRADPVDAEQFLRTCMDFGSNLTVSLGWTTPTNVEELRCRRGYAWREMLDMYAKVAPFIEETSRNGTVAPPRITFAVRMILVKVTSFKLSFLMDVCATKAGGDQQEWADRFSYTLWTSTSADRLLMDDYVAVTRLRMTLGRDRVFVDLPPDNAACLRELDPFGGADQSADRSSDQVENGGGGTFDPNQWEIIRPAIDDRFLASDRLGVVFLDESRTKLRSKSAASRLVMQVIAVENSAVRSPPPGFVMSDSDKSIVDDSILINLVDGDRTIWTLRISAIDCPTDQARSDRPMIDCIRVQPEETYSIAVEVNAADRSIKIDHNQDQDSIDQETTTESIVANRLSESTCPDIFLNCSRFVPVTDPPFLANRQSVIRRFDQAIPNDYRFVIEKFGVSNDWILRKLILT